MNAEAGKNPGGNEAGSGGSSVWPFGTDEAPLHCAGQVVSARFVRPEDAPVAPVAPAGTSCVELTVRSSHRPRGSGRVVSRVVETRPGRPAEDVTAAKQPPRPAKVVTPAPPVAEEAGPPQPEPLITAAPEPQPSPALPALPGPVGPSLPERVEPTEPPPGQELIKFHRMMRGRYKWAALLAIVGLLGGGYAGWKLGKQTYQSSGLVRVMAVLPKIMSNDKDVMPMFDSYIEAQASLLRSQKVMNMAMLKPAWAQLNRGNDNDAKLRFAESISVTRQLEMIQVQVEDPDPAAAMVAVRTLIESFVALSVEQESTQEQTRLGVLAKQASELEASLNGIRRQIAELTSLYNTDQLDPLVTAQLDAVTKLEERVDDARLGLAAVERSRDGKWASELSLEQLAQFDRRLQGMLSEEAVLDSEVRQLRQSVGPAHNRRTAAEGALDQIGKDIEGRVAELRQKYAGGFVPEMQAQGLDEAALRERLTSHEKELATAKANAATIGQHALQLKQRIEQAKATERALDQVRAFLDDLDLEKVAPGRTEVVSFGDTPLKAHRDTRITFAAAGGLGGFMIGFGVIAALALCDRRLRSPDEAVGEGNGIPMLGLLPRLSLDLADPQEAATAAHCVHEIRTLLQIWGRGRDTQCFAITSPTPGTGKTSLTLALGSAYALAGRRTLLIDADLVGAGLTTRVDAIIRRRIGRILRNEGLVTPQQLDEALKLSQHSAARLGEILVQLGYVSEQDLNRAVLLQQNDNQPVGLIDALEGHDLPECVVELGIENLWVLPAGSADARYVPALSPDGLGRLIAAAREKFDIVLIDTGPMPGSLEASVVTALADGVILTVSRGEQKSMVQRSINQLISVGARVTGVVFNRASHHDVSRYGSSSGASLRAGRSLSRGPVRYAPSPAAARLGPLAQAVASFAPGGCADASIGGSVIANANASSAASGEQRA